MTDKDWHRKALVVIVTLYVPFLISLSLLTGHLQRLGDASLFFSSNDAQGYKLIADYYTSFGHSKRPSDYLLSFRSFLFPVYLGLYKVIGIAGVEVLQMLLNVASLWLVCVSTKALSNRSWIAVACTLPLALTPSFNFLVFHGLTESLSMFLICLFIALVTSYQKTQNRNHLFVANFVVALLACIKPIMLAFWIVSLAYYVGSSLREGFWGVWRPIVCTTPVFLQLIITFSLTADVPLSSSKGVNIAGWYFPAVYGMQEYGKLVGNKSEEAREGMKKYPDVNDRMRYMMTNYSAAMKAYLYTLLFHNLIAGSNFGRPSGYAADDRRTIFDALLRWSGYLNRILLSLHGSMALLFIWLAVAGRKLYQEKTLMACYIFALMLMLPLGFPHSQGDRYIVIAQPLWLVAHGGLAGLFLDLLRRKWSQGSIVLQASKSANTNC